MHGPRGEARSVGVGEADDDGVGRADPRRRLGERLEHVARGAERRRRAIPRVSAPDRVDAATRPPSRGSSASRGRPWDAKSSSIARRTRLPPRGTAPGRAPRRRSARRGARRRSTRPMRSVRRTASTARSGASASSAGARPSSRASLRGDARGARLRVRRPQPHGLGRGAAAVRALARSTGDAARAAERAPRALLPLPAAAHRADGQRAVDGHAVAALRAMELAFDARACTMKVHEIAAGSPPPASKLGHLTPSRTVRRDFCSLTVPILYPVQTNEPHARPGSPQPRSGSGPSANGSRGSPGCPAALDADGLVRRLRRRADDQRDRLAHGRPRQARLLHRARGTRSRRAAPGGNRAARDGAGEPRRDRARRASRPCSSSSA